MKIAKTDLMNMSVKLLSSVKMMNTSVHPENVLNSFKDAIWWLIAPMEKMKLFVRKCIALLMSFVAMIRHALKVISIVMEKMIVLIILTNKIALV